jgi:hypothetical protein
MLKAKPHWLASEAPAGEYRVDAVALELFLRGAAVSNHGEDGFVRLVREEVSLAARYAVTSARIHLVRRPEKTRQTKRLFDDLRQILLRLNRNKDLNPTDLLIYTRPNLLMRPDQKRLLSMLQLSENEFRHYLASYRVCSEGGNKDRLTGQFIDEIFELWCRCVLVELNNEAQVFNKLLVAAWRDVRFPTQEQAGQRLEDWLADRVRKHFSDGVVSSRKDRQELDLELAKERMCSGPGQLPITVQTPPRAAGRRSTTN